MHFTTNQLEIAYPGQEGLEWFDFSDAKSQVLSILSIDRPVDSLSIDFEQETISCDGNKSIIHGLAGLEPQLLKAIDHAPVDMSNVENLCNEFINGRITEDELDFAFFLESMGNGKSPWVARFLERLNQED